MFKKTKIALASLAGIFATQAASAAIVIADFDALVFENGDTNSIGNVHQENDFSFSVPSDIFVLGTEESRYSGDPALLNATESFMSVTNDNGDLFDLESITLSEFLDNNAPSVSLQGVLADDTIVSTTLTLDGGLIAPETFLAESDFSGFNGLKELRIGQQSPLHQLNQVSFDVSAIPEPAGSAMLLGGLVALFAVARRRRLIDEGKIEAPGQKHNEQTAPAPKGPQPYA